MKTTIEISGQIDGNYKLKAKLHNYLNENKGMFNRFYLEYPSKKEAKNDLKNAFKSFCKEMPEEKNKRTGFYFNSDKTILYWDASKAEIIE